MANEENLIPFTSDQNREEAKKNGHKGGIASGEARRAKKTIAECLNKYLDEADESGLTKRELLTMKVLKTAFDKGSAKDLKIITELVGELTQKVEVDNKGQVVLLPNEVIESINKAKK